MLVIGSGGGLDVAVALWFGAGEVDAVDINPTTVDLVSNRYSEFIGGLFERDNVRLHLEDGRSFVRRSKRRHDVITLFAVDTLGALSTGAYVLSENYLYTVEAFKDYWRDLEDDGMIQIARWYFPEFPRETLRIFTTAYEAMAYSGVKEPGRHLLIVTDARDRFFADIIISKKPFTDERLASVGGWLAMNNLKVVYDPTKDLGSTAFDRFVRYAGGGKKAEFYKDYVFNVKPVTDNNPFFFQYGRWSHVFKAYPMAENVFESIVGKWPFLTLLALIAQTVVMVVFLVWIPVLRLKRDATRPGGGRIYVIAYFALLGTAFMFIEISMIQKLVLVLGHPIYSMAVTIPTILVMAGLGSLYTDYTRMKRSTMVVAAILALAVLMFGWSFMGTVISEAVLASSLTIRILASIMLLLPMGFLMGIPFPLGMRGISSTQEMVPIAWATNGGMSVIGSVVAIVLAMVTGFPYVASIAAVLYLLALLCYFPMVRGVDK